MSKELRKLFSDYDKADGALCRKRDELYPVGTIVRNTLTNTTGKVIGGSLYADQVNTNVGHMGWRWLETISTDEVTK